MVQLNMSDRPKPYWGVSAARGLLAASLLGLAACSLPEPTRTPVPFARPVLTPLPKGAFQTDAERKIGGPPTPTSPAHPPIIAIPVRPEEIPTLVKPSIKPAIELTIDTKSRELSVLDSKTKAMFMPGGIIVNHTDLKVPGISQLFYDLLFDPRFNIPRRSDMVSLTVVVSPSVETDRGYEAALGRIDPLHLGQYFYIYTQTLRHDPRIRNINLISLSDAVKTAMRTPTPNQSSLAHETSIELSFRWIRGMVSMVNDGVPTKTPIDNDLLKQAIRQNPPFQLNNTKEELEELARKAPFIPGNPRILY